MRRADLKVTVAAALFAAVGSVAAPAAVMAAKTGDRAPDFSLTDFDGKPVNLADLKGKVVLVDFWASWCAPCKKELPILDQLAKKYTADGKPVVVVAVNIDQDRGNAQKIVHELKISGLRIGLDPAGKVAGAYDVPTMPSSYVIDTQGAIRLVHPGFEPGDERDLAAAIDGALK